MTHNIWQLFNFCLGSFKCFGLPQLPPLEYWNIGPGETSRTIASFHFFGLLKFFGFYHKVTLTLHFGWGGVNWAQTCLQQNRIFQNFVRFSWMLKMGWRFGGWGKIPTDDRVRWYEVGLTIVQMIAFAGFICLCISEYLLETQHRKYQ